MSALFGVVPLGNVVRLFRVEVEVNFLNRLL